MSDAPAMHEVLGADAPSNWRGACSTTWSDPARQPRLEFPMSPPRSRWSAVTGAPVNPVAIR